MLAITKLPCLIEPYYLVVALGLQEMNKKGCMSMNSSFSTVKSSTVMTSNYALQSSH